MKTIEEAVQNLAGVVFDPDKHPQAYDMTHKGLKVTVMFLPGGGISIRTELGSVPGWYEDIDAACAAAEYMIRYPARFEAFIDPWESPRRITLGEMEGIPSWHNPQVKTIEEAYSIMKLYTYGQIVPKAFHKGLNNGIYRAFLVTLKGKALVFTRDVYVVRLVDGKVVVLDPGYWDQARKTMTDDQVIGGINFILDQINTAKHTLIK